MDGQQGKNYGNYKTKHTDTKNLCKNTFFIDEIKNPPRKLLPRRIIIRFYVNLSALDGLLKTADTHHGEDVSHTKEDDGDADEDRERDSSSLHVLKSEESKDDAD